MKTVFPIAIIKSMLTNVNFSASNMNRSFLMAIGLAFSLVSSKVSKVHGNEIFSLKRFFNRSGDGAGVGKGRTIAGVIYENYLKVRHSSIKDRFDHLLEGAQASHLGVGEQ